MAIPIKDVELAGNIESHKTKTRKGKGRVSAGKALVSLNDVLDISGTVHVVLNFAIRETALEEIWARSAHSQLYEICDRSSQENC